VEVTSPTASNHGKNKQKLGFIDGLKERQSVTRNKIGL